MPHIPHTIVRGGVYYLNIKVPKDLRECEGFYGKAKIVESLATKEYKEALTLAPIRVGQIKQRFRELREIATGGKSSEAVATEEENDPCVFLDAPDPMLVAENMVDTFFLNLLKAAEAEVEKAFSCGDSELIDAILADARHEVELYARGIESFEGHLEREVVVGEDVLRRYLSAQEVSYTEEGMEKVKAVHDRFRRAVLEVAQRTENRCLSKQPAWELSFDSLFSHLSPYRKKDLSGVDMQSMLEELKKGLQPVANAAEASQRVTVKDLCSSYLEDQKDKGNTAKSISSAKSVTILVRAVLGDDTPIHTIGIDEVKALVDFNSSVPSGVIVGDDPKVFEAKVRQIRERDSTYKEQSKATYDNKWILVTAIFNHGVEVFPKALVTSPLNSSKVKNYVARQTSTGNKRDTVEFAVDELNQLFRQPLYTGHAPLSEGAGWKRSGEELDRKSGRFWAPLFMLFHGCRLNEIAQMMSEDVDTEFDIPYVRISPFFGLEGEVQTPKRLKNKNSQRKVPIHPELIYSGFLNFVRERKAEGAMWLFPEWVHGSVKDWKVGDPLPEQMGKHSDLASDHCLKLYFTVIDGERKPRPNSHSFRHGVMTALNRAGVSITLAESLLGWDDKEASMAKHYGSMPIEILYEEVKKVEFEGLDISHLYTKSPRRN